MNINTQEDGLNVSPTPSRPHSCRNCGQIGHVHKDCPHPITSFGVICYRITPNNKII